MIPSMIRSATAFLPGLIAVLLLSLPGRTAFASASETTGLLIASGGEHVWFVLKDPETPATWRLMHHSTGMDGPHARVARSLTVKPVGLAAAGDEVLVLLPPTAQRSEQFDLLRLRAARNPAMGTYYDLPLDGWDVLASVPREGVLGGLRLARDGSPLALLLPARKVSEGVTRTRGSRTGASAPEARLLRQSAFAWDEVALPEVLRTSAEQRLVPPAGLAQASILAGDPEGGSVRHDWSGEAWSTRPGPARWDAILAVASVGDLLAFVTRGTDGLEFGLERGDALLPIATVPLPERPWGVASMGDGLVLIEVDGAGEPVVRSIDPLAGTVGQPVTWTRPPLRVSNWLHLPIIGMLVVAALLAIVLFRPSELPDAPLRAGVVPLPLGRRMLALAIDFIPGVLLALLLFDTDPTSLASVPLWSSELAFAGPGLVIIGVTIGHETLTELLWHRSIGKAIVGGRVVASDGTPPGSGTILLRQLFKTVVLYAPILAIFVVLSPACQGVPETVSRTVVADGRAMRAREILPNEK